MRRERHTVRRRSVTTILLTDIVDSTATLARVGRDERDRILTAHFDQARRALDRHRGRDKSE